MENTEEHTLFTSGLSIHVVSWDSVTVNNFMFENLSLFSVY